ncbi:hypothetical protein [Streptomyces africanus]|uniref:hypothetical protein n=1 Tax=Streptomyces africanus TaxID=231024 RepID=UPI001FC9C47A|nr:hypothetical protein [Streptomyces africanus]
MRVLLVHGTGVRQKRFDATFDLVARSLRGHLPDADLVPCYWGGDFGVTVTGGLKSVPADQVTRGVLDDVPVAGPLEQEVALWSLLLADPLCELRVLAAASGSEDYGMPGVRSPGEAVARRLTDLAAHRPETGELRALLDSLGIAGHYGPVLRRIAGATEFAEACAHARDPVDAREVVAAVARAVTAGLLSAAKEEAVCTGAERDRLADLFSGLLGGTARAPGGRATAVLGTLALRILTQPALNHWRGPITGGSAPALGDILRYQARGGPLRDHLEGVLRSGTGPTVLIGHSLGGIALVDLLAMAAARQAPLPGVRLLVTVGSQAPFLHECGALTGLRPGAGLPPGFPDWLNIYDRQDLLAFRAQPVFPGDKRVTDHEVTSRQPFPLSHGAYWKLEALYQRIAEALPASGRPGPGAAE